MQPYKQNAKHGAPEILSDIELIAYRFDEDVFTNNSDRQYKMFSAWTRQTPDPTRAAH